MKKITVMIVPPETTKVIKFQLSMKLYYSLIVVLGVVAIYSVILIFTFGYYMYTFKEKELLKKRYKLLVEERETDKKRLGKMQKELFEMETMINKISVIIGTDVQYKTEPIPPSEDQDTSDVRWVGDQLKEYSYITRNNFLRISAPKLSPVSGWISAHFGPLKSPYTGEGTFHTGLDIMAPEGRKVRSVVDGIVIAIKDDDVLGKTLIIYNRWGFGIIYGHLKRVFKTNIDPNGLVSERELKVGDVVAMGEYVAEVGMTGKTTGPHLHYQLELLHVPIDPEMFGMEISDKGLLK